jgi:hypothetical protein
LRTSLFIRVVAMGYSALVPAYARLVVKTEAMGYSLPLACTGLGATAGALMVASLGGLRRKERLVLATMVLFALVLTAAGWLSPLAARLAGCWAALPMADACLLGAGFGAIVFYSATRTLIQTAVPDHLRGRIMGIRMIAYSGAVPLGSLGR